jgi:hypothetical protein
MADLRSVVIVTFTPVRDGAELHGKLIGNIYGNYAPYQCTVDYAQLHDKWVPLINPQDLPFHAPTMWVEASHCVDGGGDPAVKVQLLVTYYFDGRAPLVKVVA